MLTSTGANALKHRRQGDKALDVRVGEAVGTGLHWSLSSSSQGLLKSLHMSLLIVRNVAKIVVVIGAVACGQPRYSSCC